MGDVRAAAANLPAELGVTLDPFPDSVPSGSFGAVLFGTHNASGRRVAVKLQRCVARGPYEAEVIRHLMTSAGDVPPPMIPAIIGEATAGNWHYLVMDGDTKENGWKEWMDAILDAGSNVGGPNVFREDYVAERFTQVLLGLLFMHAAGVAHLDVKLENIMLEEGVVTQPYWRSLYNHSRPNVKGMGMHPTFEIHMDKIWLDG